MTKTATQQEAPMTTTKRETQHTPGPLHVVFNEVKRGYKGYRVETSAGYITAEIVEKEPDAYLYAAAPDLLAALEESLHALERLATEEARGNKAPTGLAPRTEARDLWDRARAAIRKAKGDSR